MNERPFSQACENNQQPILECLLTELANARTVLEIGSGTGQHSVYFAPRLSHLQWHTSDDVANHAGIVAWHQYQPSDNLHAPKAFLVGQHDWPCADADAVFSANTTHIMQPEQVRQMFALLAEQLPVGGVFCQYGPFNQDGQYTSDSNARFDQWLAEQGHGGIWDIDDLIALQPQLVLTRRYALPANNQLLVWHKQALA